MQVSPRAQSVGPESHPNTSVQVSGRLKLGKRIRNFPMARGRSASVATVTRKIAGNLRR